MRDVDNIRESKSKCVPILISLAISVIAASEIV